MSRRLALALAPALALCATAAAAHPAPRAVVLIAVGPPVERDAFAATGGGEDRASFAAVLTAAGTTDGLGGAGALGGGVTDRALTDIDLDQVVSSGALPAARTDGAVVAIRSAANLVPRKVARLPEPATWGMLLMGFGLIGAAVRRSFRKSEERFNERVRRIAAGELD